MHERFDEILNELVAASTVGQEVIGEVLARTSRCAPGPTSRAEISQGNLSALRPVDQRPIPQGTVSKAVKALTKFGLLEEKGIKTDSAHWHGELYLGTAWVIAGVHVERHEAHPTAVTTAIVRLDGRQASDPDTRQVDSWQRLPEVVLDQIATLLPNAPQSGGLQAESSDQPTASRGLFGIGIEVGEPVHQGVVQQLRGNPVDLAGLFRDRLADDERFDQAMPVVIENDVDALAVLATHESHHVEPDLVVAAVFDEGVGGGLIMDGRLRRGSKGRSMEVGHLQVGFPPGEAPVPGEKGFAAPCLCDGYGHVDAIAPPKRIKEELGIGNFEQVAGDHAIRVVTTAGATLGRAISHICNVVNPSKLILYIPAELDVHPPEPLSAYMSAARFEVSQAFNAPGLELDVRQLPADASELALLGVKAAATCVFQSFIEHALRLYGCQGDQETHDFVLYVAKSNSGMTNVRQFSTPMKHAIDVDGAIWSFYSSKDAAEKGASLRRAQGHSVIVVEAKPYNTAPSSEAAERAAAQFRAYLDVLQQDGNPDPRRLGERAGEQPDPGSGRIGGKRRGKAE